MGCPTKYLIDINSIFKGFACDFQLQPGDIVYVPKQFFAKVGDYVGFFTSTVEPAAHTYLRVYDATNPANMIVDR